MDFDHDLDDPDDLDVPPFLRGTAEDVDSSYPAAPSPAPVPRTARFAQRGTSLLSGAAPEEPAPALATAATFARWLAD